MKSIANLKDCLVAAAVMLMAATTPALAEYPEKNIKMIIGFSAGGGADAFIRTVGKYLPEYLGTDFDYAYHEGAEVRSRSMKC